MKKKSEFLVRSKYHKTTSLRFYVFLGVVMLTSISTLSYLGCIDNRLYLEKLLKLLPPISSGANTNIHTTNVTSPITTSATRTTHTTSSVTTVTPRKTLFTLQLGENFSEPYMPPSVESYRIVRQDATACLTNVSGDFWDFSPTFENNRSETEALTFKDEQTLSMFSFLSIFNNALSAAGIKGAIIEPSLLHCMIHPHYRFLLSKRNFNITKVPPTKNVVTYGIMGQDAVILQQKDVMANFSVAGFVPHFVIAPAPDWMKVNASTVVSHILYKRDLQTIHVVVFYQRGTYLWHDRLHPTVDPDITGLPFAKHSGAYEKFTFFPLDSDESPFYIPSTSHYFLLETVSSRFLECQRRNQGGHDPYSWHPKSHLGGMSGERFNRRAITTLRQLKSIFHPLLMNFWMWSGTMLGWFRDCDIIPYTSDVDFGAWASEVEDLSWIVHQLLNNKYVQIRELMGMKEEALEFNIHCYGLRTDVFFLYKIQNGSWCSGHSPKQGYYFRYYYPHFTLCSAELLGEKVQVPCETERVIETEYGPGWRRPVSTWNYESSVRNRGPNIYWASDRIKKTYIRY